MNTNTINTTSFQSVNKTTFFFFKRFISVVRRHSLYMCWIIKSPQLSNFLSKINQLTTHSQHISVWMSFYVVKYLVGHLKHKRTPASHMKQETEIQFFWQRNVQNPNMECFHSTLTYLKQRLHSLLHGAVKTSGIFDNLSHCCAFIQFCAVVENSCIKLQNNIITTINLHHCSHNLRSPRLHRPLWGQGSAYGSKVFFRKVSWCFHRWLPAQTGSPWWVRRLSWAAPTPQSDHSFPTVPPGSLAAPPAAPPPPTRPPPERVDRFISSPSYQQTALWILSIFY